MFNSIITPLWYANSFVDAVQDAKNKFVDTFVPDEKVAATLKEFVEAQRQFTKTVNRTVNDVYTQSVELTKSAIEKASKATKTK